MRCQSSSGQPSGLLFQKRWAPSRQEIKPHRGRKRICASHAETKQGLLGLRKTARPNSGGLNAETGMGGIEPIGKIFLLTFLFIGLADASIDTVVITWALCSIPNAPRALQQMKRVLKESGRLIFLEHGRAPDPGIAVWQDRITPLWKRIGGGCHLNRKIDDLITAAGFRITDLKTYYLPGPRPMTYTYQGVAETIGAHAAI